jgi:PAS domain S-box-containing protein
MKQLQVMLFGGQMKSVHAKFSVKNPATLSDKASPTELTDAHQKISKLKEELSLLREAFGSLSKDEERYRLMFENVILGYFSMDENARLIDANNAFLNFLGYSREELIGKRFAELLAEGVDYHINVSFPRFKRTGITNNIEWKIKKKDGSIGMVLMNGRVRYDEQGNFIQTHCMMNDITEQRKAEEALVKSEKEKALILDVMSDCVVYHDDGMKILWVNKMAAESAGMSLQELDGTCCFSSIYGRTVPCEGCPVTTAFTTKQPCTGEMRINTKVLVIGAYPVLDSQGNLMGVVQVTRDVTSQRELEKQILDASDKEQQRIGQDLHDGLGQHLTGISFLASVLHQQLSNRSIGEAVDALRIMEHSNTALGLMRTIVKGLCPVSNDPGGLMLSLRALTSNIEKLYGISCCFICREPVLIHNNTMATHLYYISNEAINNAVKHSGGNHIEVSLERDANIVQLRISDNGTGCLLENNNELKGIGLRTMAYRCKMIGADIKISSVPAEGTTITCSLPVSEI